MLGQETDVLCGGERGHDVFIEDRPPRGQMHTVRATGTLMPGLLRAEEVHDASRRAVPQLMRWSCTMELHLL
jgi:hypothetical protein